MPAWPQFRFEQIQDCLRAFHDERDWAQFHTLKDLAAAVAIEAAELQELFLWQSEEQQRATLRERRRHVEDELADVMIQALNFAAAADIDVLSAIATKIDSNAQRYSVDRARGNFRKGAGQ